jgi:nucleoside triphosphate pyrophosphatase
VRGSGIDETLEPAPIGEAVARLALRKAMAIAVEVGAGVVLGADTVVVVDDDVFGKPLDLDEARAMLGRLRGRGHDVLTGVAIVDAATGRSASATVVSCVLMARYGDDVIERYVASGEPLDKAGAYAIQGLGGDLIDAVIGSYSNVVGLPLGETRRLLEAFGVPTGEVRVRA